jgi:hypothetical protein
VDRGRTSSAACFVDAVVANRRAWSLERLGGLVRSRPCGKCTELAALGIIVRVAFVRFVLPHNHPDSGLPEGVFRAAYRLRDAAPLGSPQRAALDDLLGWLDKNLSTPTRFNRTKSKGYYRRSTRGISWLKESATVHVAKMEELVRILGEHGYEITKISETRVGYRVYEDEHQIVAEPFADTKIK